MSSKFIISAILAMVLSAGCSVLEERGNCPCVLFLDFSAVDTEAYDSLSVWVRASGAFSHMCSIGREQMRDGLHISVPERGRASVCVLPAGHDAFMDQEYNFVIPLGTQCPQLRFFACSCDTSSDSALVPVTMDKNYALVNMRVVSAQPGQYSWYLKSAFCGFCTDGTPLEGLLYHPVSVDAGGNSRFCVARQGDDSLCLEVRTKAGSASSFALGQALRNMGYDWGAKDLDDIDITVNFSTGMLFLKSGMWQQEVLIPLLF